MDESAGSGTARTEDGPCRTVGKRKNANKIITYRKRRGMLYAGLDVHKKTIQVAVLDGKRRILLNQKITHTPEAVQGMTDRLPPHTKYVMESSSVWEATYRFMTETLGLDVTLSNPHTTLLIAKSKKKTDKVDAVVLAGMHCGGYIAHCYVPNVKTSEERKLVRHRSSLVRKRTACKNAIHGILLQSNFQTKATSFSTPWIHQVRGLKDYGIADLLEQIGHLNVHIRGSDRRIAQAVRENENARLITSIPGFANFSALAVASMIGDIERFNRPETLCAYAGLVPSVRSSASKTYYGPITHRGDRLLRWILVECTLTHIVHAPTDSYIARFYARVAQKRGKSKSLVAAASKMLRVVFHLLKERRKWKP